MESTVLNHFFELLTPGEWMVRIGFISALFILLFLNAIDSSQFISGLFAIYLIFFAGFGQYSSSMFTNMDQWTWKKGEEHLSFNGTGFYVTPNKVITNEHVIENCDEIAVRGKDGTVSEATLLNKNVEKDLALLETNNTSDFISILRTEPHKVDEPIFTPEYTKERGVFMRKLGFISDDAEDDSEISYTNLGGRGGNSGSPIYDLKGYLIGVVHSGNMVSLYPYRTGYGESLKSLREFLHINNIQYYFTDTQESRFEVQPKFKENMAVGILCSGGLI